MSIETEDRPAPRKRGRPRKQLVDGAKNPLRKAKVRAKRPEPSIARIELDHTIHTLINLIKRAAHPIHSYEVSKIREIARGVDASGDDLDDFLGDLRRELHVALGTRLDTDATLPRDVVDVLEFIDSIAERLREAADALTEIFKHDAE